MSTDVDQPIQKVVVKRQGLGLFGWAYHCNCCLNRPGRGGMLFDQALRMAIRHAEKHHPKIDWDEILTSGGQFD